MCRFTHLSGDETAANFQHFLRRAQYFGDQSITSCQGLDPSVWDAIVAVGAEYPNVTKESVAYARECFQRQCAMA